jgi:hypothetical protein
MVKKCKKRCCLKCPERLSPRPLLANLPKTLEKVDSEGMCETFSKPEILRKLGVVLSASINALVNGYR